MLTEQAGIGAGRAVENDDGYTLTFRQRVHDHYTTSLATVQEAVQNRRELLRYDLRAHSQAANTVETAAYVFPDDQGTGYLYDLPSRCVWRTPSTTAPARAPTERSMPAPTWCPPTNRATCS
jgi:hypothetical protein